MLDTYGSAISGIESGGRYGVLGPIIPKTGDRAYGKYQVMGANIPVWTEQYLGRRMTPDEFLADPQAQDAVFKGEFGKYVQRYGPEGASRAWFAGENNMNNMGAKDPLGTSVADYERKFAAGIGQQPVPRGLLEQQPQQGLLAQNTHVPGAYSGAFPDPNAQAQQAGGILGGAAPQGAQQPQQQPQQPTPQLRMLQHLPINIPPTLYQRARMRA